MRDWDSGPVDLGPFRLGETLGRGTASRVFLAEHRSARVPVAIKVLTSERARNPRFLESFRNEMRAVAALDHGGIVVVHDHGLVEAEAASASAGVLVAGSPFLVMEPASDGSLARLASPSRPAPGWAELREVLEGILDALAHAHARGVVHRDLKPSNVLLDTPSALRPRTRLTDFELAHASERTPTIHLSEAFAGTPYYMAPEQCLCHWRDYGPWTDLYALGCMAFQMTCGELPFVGASVWEVVSQHLGGRRQPLQPRMPLPPGFEGWIDALLAPDPRRRFQRAADALFALEALGDPVGAPEGAGLVPPDLRPTTPPWAFPADTLRLERGEMPLTVSAEALETSTFSAAARGIPPLPEHWRPRWPPARTPLLHGAGLGLFGARAVPLVGREADRDQLWRALRRVAEHGASRAVLLRGPAGCGKTRLMRWLCERAHAAGGATVLRAVHGPLEGPSDGLGPMVARHLRVEGLARAQVLERTEALLRAGGVSQPDEWQALTELCSPAGEEDRASGARVVWFRQVSERYVLVQRVLQRAARERPVILCLDDVQWGMDALEFLTGFLATQSMAPVPVLVLVGVREEALAERTAEASLLGKLTAASGVETIPVGPLPETEWPVLVQEILGLEGSTAAQVQERAAGNPLFAFQLVGDWVERGVLEPGESGFRLRAGEAVDLPEDLQAVWSQRIERLIRVRPAHEGRALEIAAVLGHEVRGPEWRAACRAAGLKSADGLIEALAAERLVVPGPEGLRGGWSFAHGMLREVLERRAREGGRLQKHHGACAAMLSDWQSPRRDERLGRHVLLAGEPGRAIGPLLAAATARHTGGEFRMAELLLEELQAATKQVGLASSDPRVIEAWLLWAQVKREQGQLDAAEAWAVHAMKEAQAAARGADVAAARYHLARVVTDRGQLDRALDELQEAQRLADEAGDELLAAMIASRTGHVLRHLGRLDQARETLDRAWAGLQGADEYTKGYNRHQAGVVAIVQGRNAESGPLLEAALTHQERCGARQEVGNTYNALGELYRAVGDLDLAEATYARAVELLEATGSSSQIFPKLNRGLVLFARERFREARPHFEECLRLAESQGRSHLAAVLQVDLAVCAAEEGRWEAWDGCLGAALAQLEATRYVDNDTAQVARLAGERALRAGDPGRARQAFELAEKQWRALGREDEAGAVSGEIAKLDAAALPGKP